MKCHNNCRGAVMTLNCESKRYRFYTCSVCQSFTAERKEDECCKNDTVEGKGGDGVDE